MECQLCDFDGTMDWQWFVVNIDDEDDSFFTCELEHEYWNNPQYRKSETYWCPECESMQI